MKSLDDLCNAMNYKMMSKCNQTSATLPLTHDQIIVRVQRFRDYLITQADEWGKALEQRQRELHKRGQDCSGDDEYAWLQRCVDTSWDYIIKYDHLFEGFTVS